MGKIKSILCMLGFLWAFSGAQAQDSDRTLQAGRFGFGVRNSVNYFTGNSSLGLGAGGQFKIAFSPKVNSEFFLDYISSNVHDYAWRKDYHIGWAVQFALGGEFGQGIRPYVMGGQCFDLTRAGIPFREEVGPVFSAAVQLGGGASYFISPNFEMNLQLQYMAHLTKEVEIIAPEEGVLPSVEIEKGAHFDGHLLTTLSFNFYFLSLWK